ncbi:uncharacterized protein LOC5512611 [Nematostella vectensis]|uniref:uncharacterized protein LOC5512611 n=1 Tax=Nematostella vectensis TaxID=45351 RepID=UPI00207728CC|nr:uncharacterized protein LOC5512611 [Nematostella vectensis]
MAFACSLQITVCMNSPNDGSTVEKCVSFDFDRRESRSWQDIVQQIKQEVDFSWEEQDKEWAFQYCDDEGDIIFGRTDNEWQEAVEHGCSSSDATLQINVFPIVSTKPKKTCGTSKSCCSKPCTGFTRPIPATPENDGAVPQKVVNATLQDFMYSNEALRAVALPLGALGGGSVALAGDGGLRQWQISGAVNHTAHVPNSFFAIRVEQTNSVKAVALQSNTWYDQTGFKPAAYISDHVVPEASKDLLKTIPGVKTITVGAKYPIAEVSYLSDEVPVQVHLEAFSPCIPLDSKNSGIPVIMFNFSVTNITSSDAQVSLLGSLQNIAGWDGLSDIGLDGPTGSWISNPGFGSNLNYTLSKSGFFEGIGMFKPKLGDSKLNENGHVAIAVVPNDRDKQIDRVLQYQSVKDLWSNFQKLQFDGSVAPQLSPEGKTWNGAMCSTRNIAANATETFTFLLAWHFPHRYVNWSQSGFGINDPNSAYYIGTKYSEYWKNIEEVLFYSTSNLKDLQTKTRAFRDSMFDTSLPWQLVDSAAGRVSVLKSPNCMWHADGNFYGFEGCSPKEGCCPLNCTHVWNYEMALAKCFPDLERTMRNVDLLLQITPTAVIPSRTTVPLTLRRVWTFWENYTEDPASTMICVDGDVGTVLKTYREVRQGAPKTWFNKMWPQVKRIMKRWMTDLDNGTGVIPGPQPNTYDCTLYGVNVYISGYYLAGLRAAEKMAKIQNEPELAATYHQRFELGSAKIDKTLFNGSWYIQEVDSEHPVNVVGDATWVDCLVGQWWAHALGLGYILSQKNIQSTLQNIFLKNHVERFVPATQAPRQFFDERDAGLRICVYPNDLPKSPLLYHSEGAWTGLEYEYAELCFYEGLNDIGLKVLTDTRNKYDGTRRSPWNEIECGDHYARPMASFLLFEVASGQDWNFTSEGLVNLSFAPRLSQTDFRGFFILGSCWGQYVQKGNDGMTSGTVELVIKYGDLKLAELRLASNAKNASARLSGQSADYVPATPIQENGTIKLVFGGNGCLITAGQSLIVAMTE